MPEYNGVSFDQAMSILPEHIGIWLNLIMLTAFLAVFFIKKREAQVILGSFILSIPFTLFIYSNVGIASKLVGLGHVIFWLPAAIYAFVQIWRKQLYQNEGIYQKVFVLWLTIAAGFFLASNYWDVPDAVMYVANSCTIQDLSAACNHVDLLGRIAEFKTNN